MDNRDLISQYVDTGLSIGEYQFNQLSNNDKRTYIRKRIIAHGQDKYLTEFEFNYLDDASKLKFLEDCVNSRSGFFVYVSERYNYKDTINGIFNMIYNRYKDVGIPDFVLSPFLNIEDDSEVIKKITDKEYLNFLSPYVISKVVNSEYLTDDDVNRLAEYFINTDKIRVKLLNQNYLNFVYNVTDVRIIDYILKDSFIVEHIGVLMAKLPKIKKAYYVALKIKKIDDEYDYLSDNGRGNLDRLINKLQDEQ
jgi:hypothetical protein